MRKAVLLIFLVILVTDLLFAQGEIAEQPRIFYRNEKSIGFLLNTNGWGISGRYGKRINARRKIIYEIDFAGIKHPKEVKMTSQFNNNRSFVYGKLNSFFNLRGGYGYQKELFRKIDRGGISIRRYYSFGPTIGLLKPVYYEVLYFKGSSFYDNYLQTEKFDPSTHIQPVNIYGRASFFKGINEISIVPGAYSRLGFSFEYSRNDIQLHAIETGVAIDIFIKEIPIMATEYNSFYFLSFFVSYRFGKVFDARGIINEKDLLY